MRAVVQRVSSASVDVRAADGAFVRKGEIGAGLLVLLSDIDGIFTADPHRDPDAKLIPEVHCIDDGVMALGGGSGAQ